ncbi:MAG: FecR domain-containing protein, partial [Hyphomicrobiaceae bacterium]|nr:FecR domain-containing protein [Hyphomicrobiaceae bacterium]
MNATLNLKTSSSIRRLFALMAFTLAALVPGLAWADEWVADQLRGNVLVFSSGDWVQLERGDIVDDDRYIRTMGSGRVTFMRGNEVIEMAGNTQMRIKDSNGRQFTTVLQDFGTVSIEAEVQNVQHFAVETPFLAAVVKGTRFTVSVGNDNASVKVDRGLVEVQDHMHGMKTFVPAGQRAKVQQNRAMQISGSGQRYMFIADNGELMTPADADDKVRSGGNNNNPGGGNNSAANQDQAVANNNSNANSGNGGSGNGGSGNGGSNNSGGNSSNNASAKSNNG